MSASKQKGGWTLVRRLVVGLIVLLVVGEAALRLVPRSWVPRLRLVDRVYTARSAWTRMMAGDPYLGYKLKPDVDMRFPSEGRRIPFQTTDLGFEDIGFRDIGTREPFPIIALGGSFAVCDDVPSEACWVRRLSDSLGVSAATLGVNGYSTLAAARIFERYGRRLEPQLVLLEVHPNDFRDNETFEMWSRTGSGDLWEWLGEQRGRTPLVRWLGRRSMLFRLADSSFRGFHRQIYDHVDDRLDFVFRFDSWFVRVVREGEQHPGWPSTKQSLIQIRDQARAQGAELVPVLFPIKEQVYRELIRDRAPAGVGGALDRPIDMVASFCEAEGLDYCDMRPALRAAAAEHVQVYHRISAHMNDEGNAVSARAVEECLRAKGLLQRLHQPSEDRS